MNCEACNASVLDTNLPLHKIRVHGIIEGKKIEPETEQHVLSNIYYSQANKFFDEKRYKEAETLLSKAIECYPKNIDAYLLLATVFDTHRHHCASVEATLKKALEIEPDNSKALRMLADHLGSHGKHAEAIQILQNARNSDDMEIVEGLAKELMFSGKYADARKTLATALPNLREKYDNGKDEDRFMLVSSVLFTLFMCKPEEIRYETDDKVNLRFTSPYCNQCEQNMTLVRIMDDGLILEAKCEKCGDMLEFSTDGGPYSPDDMDIGKSRNPCIMSLEVVDPDKPTIELGYKIYDGDFRTKFAYDDKVSGETQIINAIANEISIKSPFILRNSEYEKKLISNFLEELTTDNDSEEEHLLAETNRLDLECDDLDTTNMEIVERIGAYRRLALQAGVNKLPEKAGEYLRLGKKLLDFVYSRSTGYETEDTTELLTEFEEDDEPPQDLVLEISKRSCSTQLLEIIRKLKDDDGNWQIGINAMYLLGVMGDSKIIPEFLSIVSELEGKDMLGNMVTEELESILSAFPDAQDALIAALKNAEYNGWVREASLGALAMTAIIYPEKRNTTVNTLREVVTGKTLVQDGIIADFKDTPKLQGKKSIQFSELPQLIECLPGDNEKLLQRTLAIDVNKLDLGDLETTRDYGEILKEVCEIQLKEHQRLKDEHARLKNEKEKYDSEILVTSAVMHLCSLQDRESLPMIHKAYADKQVDLKILPQKDAESEMEKPEIELLYFNNCRHPLELFETRW